MRCSEPLRRVTPAAPTAFPQPLFRSRCAAPPQSLSLRSLGAAMSREDIGSSSTFAATLVLFRLQPRAMLFG
jgi:hypothetical protein